MIEGQLENIVTDVKKNLNAIVTRGEKFDDLQKKSEDLNNHVSTWNLLMLISVICYAEKGKDSEIAKRKKQFCTSFCLVCVLDHHVHDDVSFHMKPELFHSINLRK